MAVVQNSRLLSRTNIRKVVAEAKAAKTAAQCAVTVVQKRLTVPVAMLPYPLEAELPAATARR